MGTFFLVWSPTGSRSPSHRHDTRQGAVNEAARLAREARGAEFFVLLGNEDEIPF